MISLLKAESVSNKQLQRIGGEFLWIGIGQGVSILGSIVGLRLITHILNPIIYGELALGMTVVSFAQQVLFGPLANATSRFFAPSVESNQLLAYLRGSWQLLARALVVIICLTGFIALGLLAFSQGKWLGLLLAAMAFSLFSGTDGILDGIQNAARQRKVVAWHQGLRQWLGFLVVIALVTVVGKSSAVAMSGYALATILVVGSQLVFLQRRIPILSPDQPTIQGKVVRAWCKQMFDYSWPFVVWGLFTWAQLSSDRWALQTLVSTREVGLYAVLYQLSYYPITLLSGLMVQLVAPIFYHKAGDGSNKMRVQHVYRINNWLILVSMGLTLIGTIIAFFLHHQIFSLLTTSQYAEISWLMPWMVLSGGIFAAGQFASLSLMSGKKTRSLIAPKVLTALLGILLSFTGAAWLGLPGVVSAGIIFSCVYLVWILYLVGVQSRRSSQISL